MWVEQIPLVASHTVCTRIGLSMLKMARPS